MRASRIVIVAGGCSAVLGAGWAAAPSTAPDSGFLGPDLNPNAASRVYEGPVVTNIKGRYQVEIAVTDGVVTDIHVLEAGTPVAESVGVNTRAVPELKRRMVAAQTWDVEYVSGASFTSPAIVESARGAFEAAGLG